jgi:hypothetical protein
MPDNGCEVDLRTDKNHCGMCTTKCEDGPTVASQCVARQCVLACPATKGDCNHDPDDDCEIDLTTDMLNCGRCHPNQAGDPNDMPSFPGPPACRGWDQKCVPSAPGDPLPGMCVAK